MKVAIDYRDGVYTMYDPSAAKFADGVDPDSWMASNTIDISEAEWTAYNSFLVQARLWHDHMQSLSNQIDVVRQRTTKFVNIKMEDMEWSVRVSNCLRNAEIRIMGELLQRSGAELLRINGFGQRSLREVQAMLQACGVQLPADDPEKPFWMPPNQ